MRSIPDLRKDITRTSARTGRSPSAEPDGGNPTKRLRIDLKFESVAIDVVAILNGHRQINCWALLANPDVYDILGAVDNLLTDRWMTAGKDLKRGDFVLVWKAKGSESERGVIAFGDVISDPRTIDDSENPYWKRQGDASKLKKRAVVRYSMAPGLPLWTGVPGNEVLDELSVARARGGSVFRVTADQWQSVTRLAGTSPEIVEDEAAIEDHVSIKMKGGGQGRGLDQKSKVAVEMRAMKVAIKFYEQDYDRVDDRSKNSPYDLLCWSGSKELRVEVKGTITAGSKVLLTHREIESARRNSTDLFVLRLISLDRSGPEPVASQGEAMILKNWDPDSSELEAITYRLTLPQDGD